RVNWLHLNAVQKYWKTDESVTLARARCSSPRLSPNGTDFEFVSNLQPSLRCAALNPSVSISLPPQIPTRNPCLSRLPRPCRERLPQFRFSRFDFQMIVPVLVSHFLTKLTLCVTIPRESAVPRPPAP